MNTPAAKGAQCAAKHTHTSTQFKNFHSETKNMNPTQDIKERVRAGDIKTSSRELGERLRLRITLTDGLYIDYYEKWHSDSKRDHVALMQDSGARVLERRDEWDNMTEDDEQEIIDALKTKFPALFQSHVADTIFKEGTKTEEIKNTLRNTGMLRTMVLVTFGRPLELYINRKRKKHYKQKELYLFISTNGDLCYSNRGSHVASGFRWGEEMTQHILSVQELRKAY